jgi:hypothetical protein
VSRGQAVLQEVKIIAVTITFPLKSVNEILLPSCFSHSELTLKMESGFSGSIF